MKFISKFLSLVLCVLMVFVMGTVAAEAATVKVSPPTKVTATTTSDTVKLSWSKVSKATGYRVYQKSGGKWKAIKTVTSNTYTVKDLTASESYNYAVKSYRKVSGKTYYSSNYTEVKAKTKDMGSTPTPEATADKNSVTLKWTKVPGATGYRIYQYINGEWAKIKSVTTNSYKVTSLKVDTTYKFKIRPYAKTSTGTVWGKTSSAVSAVTIDKTKAVFVSSVATEDSVTLKWNKVSGATGYRLYVLQDDTWSALKTTSSLSYKVTGLKSNCAYTFMVRAYKKASGKTTWYTKSDSYMAITKPSESDLKAYRIEKYKTILDNPELYFVMSTNDSDLGETPVEFARKNGDLYIKTSVDGLTMRMYYVNKTKKTYMYVDEMWMYVVLSEEDAKGMDMQEIVEAMSIKNVGEITVSQAIFDGKVVICESYTDTETGLLMKYYFYNDELIASENVSRSGRSDIIRVSGITTTVSDKLFTRPKGYINMSGLM